MGGDKMKCLYSEKRVCKHITRNDWVKSSINKDNCLPCLLSKLLELMEEEK